MEVQRTARTRILRVILFEMKITVVSQALTPQYGGSAVSEASLCGSLQTLHPISVWCRAGALDAEFARSFGLTDVKEVHPWDVVRAWRDPSHWIRRELAETDVLHINGHWRWENILLARLAHRLRIPYLLQPRGMLWLGMRKVPLKKLFNRLWGNWAVQHAQRVIALSQFETRQWDAYGISPERTAVIPNAVPTPTQEKGDALLAPPFFLYFGRIEPRKNLVFLVRAFAKYVSDGGQADLLFVGPPQRRYDHVVARETRLLGISDRVRFLPAVYGPEKAALLRQALAVVYPAVGEPFGRVPFETLSAGGVPIVPVESGSAEYIAPFFREALYPIADRDALVAALRQMERLTGSKRAARLQSAQTWVAQNLNWNSVTEHFLNLYTQVRNESAAIRPAPSSADGALHPARAFE